MLRPMLFVGCGGSGVKTVRLIRRKVEQALRFGGYTGPFPKAWQFLAFDVPANEDSPAALKSVDGVRYVGLAENFATYKGDNGADSRLANAAGAATDFLTWRPDPEGVHANIVIGAGQQRAVGRVVTALFHAKAAPVINQATEACTTSNAELVNCARQLGFDVVGAEAMPSPLVVLVSSLGGGAGSGMFLDVADMLRMSAQAGDMWLQTNLCGVLFDPSVFDEDGHGVTGGVPPNSLAAVSEMVAGQWAPWQPSPMLTSFTGELGNFGGVEYAFLVGSTNGKVSFESPMAVYDATAEALATWVVNPDVATRVESFTLGNWAENPAQSTIPLHGGADTRLPLSSFGFARVSLGTPRFAAYAEERITRLAVAALLKRPRIDESANPLITEAEAARLRVAADGYRLVEDSLSRCGLNEHTEPDGRVDFNEVLDAIRERDLLMADVAELQKKASGAVNDPKNIVAQLENATSHLFAGLPQKYVARHRMRAIEWAVKVQDDVVDEILRVAAVEGISVAIELAEQMGNRVSRVFPEQLVAEKALLAKRGTWGTRGQVLLASKVKGAIPEGLRKKMQELVYSLAFTTIESDLRDVCAELLRDMGSGFFGPLVNELRECAASLKADQGTQQYQMLADGEVPAHLRPAPTERSMIAVGDFPSLFTSTLEATSSTVEASVVDVIGGRFGTSRTWRYADPAVRPFGITAWRPSLVADLPEPGVPSPVKLDVRLSLAALRNRSRHWLVADQQTPVGALMAMSLNQYVNDPKVSEAKRKARGEQLASLLAECFDLAAPLAEVNGAWATSTFSLVAGRLYSYDLTHIPLSPGSHGYAEVSKVLAARLNTNDPDKYFRVEPTSSIEVFSTLRPLGPSAFQSLVFPIVQSWRNSVGTHPRGDGTFWRHRRARSLVDSLALPRDIRITLARGWTTARILGRVDWSDHDRPCTIAVGDKPVKFLHPPLSGRPTSVADEFGRVIESAVLAEFLAASGTSEPLEALTELLRLGSSTGHAEGDLEYRSMNPVLKQAIDEAEAPEAYATELVELIGEEIAMLDAEIKAGHPATRFVAYPASLATADLQRRALDSLRVAIERRATAADGTKKRIGLR